MTLKYVSLEAAFLDAMNAPEHKSSGSSAGDQDSDSTFAIDTTGFVLSAYEIDTIERFNVWWAATKLQRRQGTFRFMGLPPELRERVYREAFADEAPPTAHDLSNFRMPSITRVCKQVRAESLPLFFAESSFYVKVRSNFDDRGRNSTLPWRPHRDAGVLHMPPRLQASMRKAGPAAVIRHLTMEIQSSQNGTTTGEGKSRQTLVFLRLNYIKAQLRISTEDGEGHPSRWHQYFDQYWVPKCYGAQEVSDAVKEATDKAEEFGKEEGFQGLTLKHIQTIAKQLRYMKP